MLEARSKLKAYVQTTLPFPETQPHHVLVRDRQTAAQRFADIESAVYIINLVFTVFGFVLFIKKNILYIL